MDWQLAEAKNRFSDVVTQALTVGPQRITRRNEAVFVLSEADYQKLTGARMDFLEFLSSAPKLSDLDLDRSTDGPREF